MAEPVDRETCVNRHREYEYDVGARLNPMQRERIRAMVAPIRQAEHVLDVGCNSGYITEFLPRNCIADGVDAAPALVELAKKRLHRAQVGEAETLPYQDRAVDVVILGEILEHVHDPIVVLLEARRVARRLIVGSTPHESGTWGPNGKRAPVHHRFHVRCYDRATLLDVLELAGLREIQESTICDGLGVPQIRVFSGLV